MGSSWNAFTFSLSLCGTNDSRLGSHCVSVSGEWKS